MQLRKLMNKDVNNILEWMKDEEIVQFFRFEAIDINKDIVLKFINKANLNDDSYHFAIVDENDEYIQKKEVAKAAAEYFDRVLEKNRGSIHREKICVTIEKVH